MAANTLRPIILICDDELPLRELIKAVLGDRYGYLEAEDAAQAEELIAAHRPHAIVLDVMLPGKSGIDLLKDLRSQPDGCIPVVVVSAWQTAEQAKEAREAGADAFIGKPFDPKLLSDVVADLVTA